MKIDEKSYKIYDKNKINFIKKSMILKKVDARKPL